jgi:hypothetical protein
MGIRCVRILLSWPLLFAMVLWRPDAALGADRPIALGQNAIDSIECGGNDAYMADLAIGDQVVAHMTECNDYGGVCFGVAACAFDQCLEFVDGVGQPISIECTPIDSNSCGHRTTLIAGPETVPPDGQLTIIARDANDHGRGLYGVFVQSTVNSQGAMPLTVGDSVLEFIDACGDVDTYSLLLGVDNVQIEMNADQVGSIDPHLELYDPAGAFLASSTNGRIDAALVGGRGTYTLLARSKLNETGSYRLSVSAEVVFSDGFESIGVSNAILPETPGY